MVEVRGVLPIGTPWGGPESRRYLSCLASLLMCLEEAEGDEKTLHSRHEGLNVLYLTVTGIGASGVQSDTLAPQSHEDMVDRLFPDYVERSMAYAGLQCEDVGRDAIVGGVPCVRERIAASIDAGVPVLARSTAGEWCIVSGYDDGGATLIGWDGSTGYWGPPTVKPDRYLGDGRFAWASWPDSLGRLLIVTGRTDPRRDHREVIAHVVAVMREQGPRAFEAPMMAALADDAACSTMPDKAIADLWDYTNGYIGWYAEQRCFIAGALWDQIGPADDVKGHEAVVRHLNEAAGVWSNTHDTCWEAWRAMLAKHRCNQPDDAPCRMCGGCLRPAGAEDLAAFRQPPMRRKVTALLDTIHANDRRALRELEAALAVW